MSDEIATSMDFFPTLAALCGAELPADRTIDGRDVSALWFDAAAASPHDAFFYYWQDDLEAVRVGRWKLRFWDRRPITGHDYAKAFEEGRRVDPADFRTAVRELYDLVADPGETTNLYATVDPGVIAELDRLAEWARTSLGDASTGRVGNDVRPIGRVEHARPLTTFAPDHPYYMAEYDLPDRG